MRTITIFNTGVGVIVPTKHVSDDQLLKSVEASQKPIQDAAVVCIDERQDARMPQPVREKVAGGNLNTFLTAASAIGWCEFNDSETQAGPEKMAECAARFLKDNGQKLGAHRHATPETANNVANDGVNASGCGAIDKGALIDQDIAESALDQVWIEQAKIDLGELLNMDHFKQAQAGFAKLANDTVWQNWDRTAVQKLVEAHGGVVEVLNENGDRFADPTDANYNARHGHWAQAAVINTKAGYSNDRDNADVAAFQVDVDPIVRMAKAAAGSDEEFSLLLHAMYLRQLGTTYRLTKNMRIVR